MQIISIYKKILTVLGQIKWLKPILEFLGTMLWGAGALTVGVISFIVICFAFYYVCLGLGWAAILLVYCVLRFWLTALVLLTLILIFFIGRIVKIEANSYK